MPCAIELICPIITCLDYSSSVYATVTIDTSPTTTSLPRLARFFSVVAGLAHYSVHKHCLRSFLHYFFSLRLRLLRLMPIDAMPLFHYGH